MNIKEFQRKNWLIPFIRYVKNSLPIEEIEKKLAQFKGTPLAEQLERWMQWTLHEKGFSYGWTTSEEHVEEGEEEEAELFFFEQLFHQIEMIFELSLLFGRMGKELDDFFDVLSILAAHVEAWEEVEKFMALASEEWGEKYDERRLTLAQEIGEPVRSVSRKLKDLALYNDGEPMLIFPLYQAISYLHTHQLLKIAVSYFSKNFRIDRTEVEKNTSSHYMTKVYMLEILIALARIDGEIHPVERKLIRNALSIARLNKYDNQLLLKRESQPLASMPFFQKVDDSPVKYFLLEQLKIQCFLTGDGINEKEKAFIDEFAQLMAIDEQTQLKIEAQALAFLESHPHIERKLSQTASLVRYKKHLSQRIEFVIRDNMAKLLQEIQETKELVQLLAARTHRKLTEEEEQKIKAQLLDICLTIPSLVIFSIPGGSFLLPILLKTLPFNLLPSAFTEQDEKL